MTNSNETPAEEVQQTGEVQQPPEQEEHPESEKQDSPQPVQNAEESSAPADVPAEQTEGAPQSPAFEIQPLVERIERLEQGVAQLTKNVEQLTQQVTLIPRQVRQLGTKVDDITESIGQPRVRDMLNNFLLLYDLLEQMAIAAKSDAESTKNYQVLRGQILQVLRVNGISPIPEAQRFDPEIHKAVETITCETPDEDGEIVRVYHPGFRTERAILRYVEVVVKRYQKPDDAEEEKS